MGESIGHMDIELEHKDLKNVFFRKQDRSCR